jgi:MFS family permease
VRLRITETPAFTRAIEREERVNVPIVVLLREHPRTLVLATLAAITTFVVFYLMTVFTLSFGTTELGFAREEFLLLQMIGVLFFALTIPLTALAADRIGRWPVLIGSSVAVMIFGLTFAPLFSTADAFKATLFLSVGLALMGCTYGALGTALAELFPTALRYTGASLTFNLAGILGGSLAPYIATALAARYGIAYVGYYLSAAGAITLAAQLFISRRRPQPAPAIERSAA